MTTATDQSTGITIKGVNPGGVNHGVGTKTIQAKANVVYGRLEGFISGRTGRKSTFRASATAEYGGGNSTNNLIVIQQGRAAYLEITNVSPDPTAFPAEQQTITYTGKANLKKIVLNDLYGGITFSSASINGTTVSNIYSFAGQGYEVAGDPGNLDRYDVSFTFNVPGNASTSETKEYTFKLNGQTYTIIQSASGAAPDIQTLSISPNPITLGIGEAMQLSYVAGPAGVVIPNNPTWHSNNDAVAFFWGANGTLNGASTGDGESTTVTCTVIDSNGHSMTAQANVAVYAAGTITGSVTEIGGTSTSGSGTYSQHNIVNGIAGVSMSSWTRPVWINSVTINNGTITVSCTSNSIEGQNTPARSATFTLTGTDMLGHTIVSDNITIRQAGVNNTQINCTSMDITEGGSTISSSTINNINNRSVYAVSYNPSNTTQNGCTWSLSSTQYAEIEGSTTGDSCTIHVKPGSPDAQQVTLTATNSYNNSITKSITITLYYVMPSITASPSPKNVSWNTTSDASVTISTNGIVGGLSAIAPGRNNTGIITSSSLNTTTGVLTVGMNANTQYEVSSGTVEFTGSNQDGVSVTGAATYNQAAKVDNLFTPQSLTATLDGNGIPTSVTVVARLENKQSFACDFEYATTSTAFAWELTGFATYEDWQQLSQPVFEVMSSNGDTYTTSSGSTTRTVNPVSTVNETFTFSNLGAASSVGYYHLSFSVRSVSHNVSDNYNILITEIARGDGTGSIEHSD